MLERVQWRKLPTPACVCMDMEAADDETCGPSLARKFQEQWQDNVAGNAEAMDTRLFRVFGNIR